MPTPGSQFKYDEQYIQDDKGVYPPNVIPLDAGEIVRNNERYVVRDLEVKDNAGNVIWTITITNLKNGQQTLGHLHQEGAEIFYFQKGRGLMLLKTDAINIKPGLHVGVPKGIFHKVIASANEDMLYMTYFNGPLNRPKERFKAT